MLTSPLTGDYRKKKPISVKAADVAVDMTPVGSAVDIAEELGEEDPSYGKIGLIAAGDVLGAAIPAMGPVTKSLIKGGNIRIKPKEIKPFELNEMYRDDFDWNRLDLTDYQVDAISNARKSYLISGGGAKAVEAAEKKVQDAIDARIPAIAEALKNKLKTSDKGIVSLDDYKDAVEATVRFDTVEEAAESISNQQGLLNKMGPGIMDDMLYDDKISGAFEKLPDNETFNYILDNGLDRDLAEWAVAEDAIRKSYNKYKKAANTSKPPRATKGDVDFDAKMVALDEAEDATTWQQNAKKVVKERGIDLDDKKSLEALELQKSTRLLLENKIDRNEHLYNIDRLKPVGEYNQLPREPSDKALVFALDSGKREKGVFVLNDKAASKLGANTSSLKVGDQFNSRLDIPAYLSHDTWIVAGTSPAVKTADGKGVTSYAKAVHFGGDDKPVRFIASQKQSEKIGTGVDNKTGYATVSGTVKDLDADAIRAEAAELLDDPEWTQVGFDPRRQGGFYVRTGVNKHVPVREATEVIQIGPLVLAKNAKLDIMYQGYSEGGMALEEQMMMNFGDVPDNTIGVDPVSGNEIPLGSTAENVRDDIPAQLSEGEMVIPADVVRFFGVKFFEDIRQAAKMGYSQMAEDGRIGGEPMDMEDETGLGLEMADLEVMDDGAPVEMNRGGTSMADYKDVGKNRNIKAPKRSGPRKTHAQIMAQFNNDDNNSSSSSSKPTSSKAKSSDYYSPENISKRVKDRENQPKTKAEALYRALSGYFFDNEDNKPDNRRVTLTEKPPTSDDERSKGTILEQINFGNNFADDEETKKERYKAKKPVVDKSKYTVTDLREGQDPFLTKLAKNSGLDEIFEKLGFDEGGDVVDPDVVQEGTTGGFGEEIGLGDTGVMEAREYENAAGHVIIIMFLDGVPLQEIPDGYYPVGSEPIAVDPGEEASGGSDMGDDDNDGSSAPTPTPVNFKELTMEELTQMVDDQKGMKNNIIAGGMSYLNPIVGGAIKVAMWNTTRQTKNEIKRRLESDTTSNVDKMRYENLLDIANREEPGLVKVLLGKITGDYTGPELKSPKVVEGDVSDPTMAPDQGITEAYTPETKSPETAQGYGPDIMSQVNKISEEAAANAFSGYKAPGTEDDDDDGGPTITPTKTSPAPTYTQPATDPYAEPGRPTTSNNNDDDDDGPTFAPPPPPPSYTAPGGIYSEPGRPTKSSGRRSGGGGKNKGGMMRKAKKKK